MFGTAPRRNNALSRCPATTPMRSWPPCTPHAPWCTIRSVIDIPINIKTFATTVTLCVAYLTWYSVNIANRTRYSVPLTTRIRYSDRQNLPCLFDALTGLSLDFYGDITQTKYLKEFIAQIQYSRNLEKYFKLLSVPYRDNIEPALEDNTHVSHPYCRVDLRTSHTPTLVQYSTCDGWSGIGYAMKGRGGGGERALIQNVE